MARFPDYGVRSTTGRVHSGFSRDGAIKAVTGGDDFRSVAGPAPNLLGGEVVVRYDEDTPSGKVQTTDWETDVSAMLAVVAWWAHKAQSYLERADDCLTQGQLEQDGQSIQVLTAASGLHEQLRACQVLAGTIDGKLVDAVLSKGSSHD